MQLTYNLTLPTGWQQLTSEQLTYVAQLIAAGFQPDELTTYFLLRSLPPHLLQHIPPTQLAAALPTLDYLKQPPTIPLRPQRIGKATAIEAGLHGTDFATYLTIENLWQALIDNATSNDEERTTAQANLNATQTDIVKELLGILYNHYHPKTYQPWHAAVIIIWLTGLHAYLPTIFPYLFRPIPRSNAAAPVDMRGVMETQIRALTMGDITKRHDVLSSDLWAALDELDNKARETDELKHIKK